MKKNNAICHLGEMRLLKRKPIAFFCSRQCPGEIILKAQDWANAHVGQPQPVISGFHTPIETDVLRILLRGNHPVIVCLARGLEGYRIPKSFKSGIDAGTVLLLSIFNANHKRASAQLAEKRNRHILMITKQALFAYAAPDSQTWKLANLAKQQGVHIQTLKSVYNDGLGAKG